MDGAGSAGSGLRGTASRLVLAIQNSARARRLGRSLLGRLVSVRRLSDGERAQVVSRLAGRRAAGTQTVPGHIYFVAYVLGRPVGVIEVFEHPTDARALPGWWTGGLFVRPRYRGLGAGERLLAAAVRTARQSGAPRLLLWTAPGNTRMLRLSTKLGFVVLDDPELRAQCREVTGVEQVVLCRTFSAQEPAAAPGAPGPS